MKLIPLNTKQRRGSINELKYTMVDDEDYDYLMQWKWCSKKAKHDNTFYVTRTDRSDNRNKTIRMHRIILKIEDPNILVDHIDHNGLNNQKNNIRKATHAQNMRNLKINRPRSSPYNGVYKETIKYKNKIYTRWKAAIAVENVVLYLGILPLTPENEILAAKRYDIAAKYFCNEFVNLNFPPELSDDQKFDKYIQALNETTIPEFESDEYKNFVPTIQETIFKIAESAVEEYNKLKNQQYAR